METKFESKLNKVPQIVNFIWIGGSIPDKYIQTIYHLAALSKKEFFEINLWTDNEIKIQKVCDRLELPAGRVKLRNIEEAMQEYAEVKSSKEFSSLSKLIYSEMSGEMKNFAAATDVLRFLILYKVGGFYLDCDIDIKNYNSKTMKNSTLSEIKAIVDNNKFGFGKSNRVDQIVSTKNNEIVLNIIGKFLELYKQLEETKSTFYIKGKGETNRKLMIDGLTAKRNNNVMWSENQPLNKRPFIAFTMGNINGAIVEGLEQYCKTKEIEEDTFKILKMLEVEASSITHRHDNSWHPKEKHQGKKIRSSDDSALKTGFNRYEMFTVNSHNKPGDLTNKDNHESPSPASNFPH